MRFLCDFFINIYVIRQLCSFHCFNQMVHFFFCIFKFFERFVIPFVIIIIIYVIHYCVSSFFSCGSFSKSLHGICRDRSIVLHCRFLLHSSHVCFIIRPPVVYVTKYVQLHQPSIRYRLLYLLYFCLNFLYIRPVMFAIFQVLSV